VFEPIAFRKLTHEKDSSVSDAMLTPATTGSSVAYTCCVSVYVCSDCGGQCMRALARACVCTRWQEDAVTMAVSELRKSINCKQHLLQLLVQCPCQSASSASASAAIVLTFVLQSGAAMRTGGRATESSVSGEITPILCSMRAITPRSALSRFSKQLWQHYCNMLVIAFAAIAPARKMHVMPASLIAAAARLCKCSSDHY
jgi:hypothetical protein